MSRSFPNRIAKRFAQLKADKRAGFVAYVTAGDPDPSVCLEILKGLPAAGADLIELGMPFTDPMADGVSVQLAGQRALKAGITVDATFDMVRRFRKETGDGDTPILLMGYYNLVYRRGAERFCKDAADAGIDGFILVDLPPEEADELKPHAEAAGIDTVLLTAPTTDDERLPAVLKFASGFIYFVSVLGVTGTKSATEEAVRAHVGRIKRHTTLPVAVGFGIKTPDQAAVVARHADAAVVGSAIVDRVKAGLDDKGKPKPDLVPGVFAYVRALADGVRRVRKG
jgi:tryptophan synthase alpha chain